MSSSFTGAEEAEEYLTSSEWRILGLRTAEKNSKKTEQERGNTSSHDEFSSQATSKQNGRRDLASLEISRDHEISRDFERNPKKEIWSRNWGEHPQGAQEGTF